MSCIMRAETMKHLTRCCVHNCSNTSPVSQREATASCVGLHALGSHGFQARMHSEASLSWSHGPFLYTIFLRELVDAHFIAGLSHSCGIRWTGKCKGRNRGAHERLQERGTTKKVGIVMVSKQMDKPSQFLEPSTCIQAGFYMSVPLSLLK